MAIIQIFRGRHRASGRGCTARGGRRPACWSTGLLLSCILFFMPLSGGAFAGAAAGRGEDLAPAASASTGGGAVSSEDDVQELSIRVQRCLAGFEGEMVVLRIEYRGNLISGHRLTIYGVDAEVPPEDGLGEGGILGDMSLFAPQDRYAPHGFLEKIRGRFKIPFMRHLSSKYGRSLLKVDTILSKEDYNLVVSDEEKEGLVQVQGYEDYVYLPDVFAHETDDGTIAGAIRKDADGDRILNVFDPHPFYFDEIPEEDEDLDDRFDEQAEDQVEDQAEDQVEDQVEDQAEDRAKDKLEEEAGDRTREGYRRYERVKVRTPKPEELGHVGRHAARRFSFARFFAKPWIAIPALAVVYVGLDRTVFDDDDEVRRTGVLVEN